MDATGHVPIRKRQPKDADDALKRALFYAHSLHRYCKRHIDQLIARCDQGEFGEMLQELTIDGVSDWSFASAVKILTCMNIHLVGLETCDTDGPPWLIEFLFEALKEMDDQFPAPMAREILEEHGRALPDKMIKGTAIHVVQQLGLPPEAEDALHVVEQFLITTKPYRNELLIFALSQPTEALRRQLRLME